MGLRRIGTGYYKGCVNAGATAGKSDTAVAFLVVLLSLFDLSIGSFVADLRKARHFDWSQGICNHVGGGGGWAVTQKANKLFTIAVGI